MDNELKTSEVFVSEIPPLIYMNKSESTFVKNVNKIHLHQATYTLLYDMDIATQIQIVKYVKCF